MKRLCYKCKKIRSSGHFRKSKCHKSEVNWAGSLMMPPRGYSTRHVTEIKQFYPIVEAK